MCGVMVAGSAAPTMLHEIREPLDGSCLFSSVCVTGDQYLRAIGDGGSQLGSMVRMAETLR